MIMPPCTVDFYAIQANLTPISRELEFDMDCVRTYAAGQLYVPPEPTTSNLRFAERVNRDMTLKRIVFARLAFIRSDGSGAAPRPVIFKLVNWAELIKEN